MTRGFQTPTHTHGFHDSPPYRGHGWMSGNPLSWLDVWKLLVMGGCLETLCLGWMSGNSLSWVERTKHLSIDFLEYVNIRILNLEKLLNNFIANKKIHKLLHLNFIQRMRKNNVFF
jgi:hypothetical protein